MRWPLLILFAACAPDSRGATGDPRCLSLCKIVEPPLAGAYDICSADSAAECRSECDARVTGVSDSCATCQLSGAGFGTGPIDAEADCDQSGTCTIDGPGGSCTYVATDTADRDRCTRIAFPRTVIECPATFNNNCGINCQ